MLPLAIRGKFTYRIPEDLLTRIRPGMRVEVHFGGKNIYFGIVCKIHDIPPDVKNVKEIIRILDEIPIINDKQLKFWFWISEYYMCSQGEVMKAALPSDTSLTSYKERLETFIEFPRKYTDKELNEILDKLGKAPRQKDLLSAYIRITGYSSGSEILPVGKSTLLAEAHSSGNIIESLTKKGILSSFSIPVSRISEKDSFKEPIPKLSESQVEAYKAIKLQFKEKEIVLLHGVTSSGKTEIYIHLIEEQLKRGKQVLYMLPEIALTTQIILRLKKHFGEVTGVYHSRFSDPEKVEIWKRVSDNNSLARYGLILGVRSSLLLPFSDLGLIIVDEEHDGSYKQHDPAPRYHARDSAIMLAALHKAKTLLGSASPSVES
jgi:primosomal protein N' (replication factor Y)